MKFFEALSADWLAIGAVAIVAAIFFFCLAVLLVNRRRTLRAAAALRGRSIASLLGESGENFEMLGPVERSLLDAIRGVIAFEADDKWVVRALPSDEVRVALHRSYRAGLGRLASRVGENLTAIALFLTFCLLGWVLISDVPAGLDSGEAKNLTSAIGKMGAKFFVSALGVLGAFLIDLVDRKSDAAIDEATARIVEQLRQIMEPHDLFLARTAYDRRRQLEGFEGKVESLGRDLSSKLSKLESLNVTVTGIGIEVTNAVQTMMTDHVAEIIARAIEDIREMVQKGAEDLRAGVGRDFADSVAKLERSLEQLNESVRNQGKSGVEEILEKLRDAVSGGFASQSQDMGKQLQRLAETIPALEGIFRQVAEELGSNARSWGEENQRAVSVLGEQVGEVVMQFKEIQTVMAGSVARLSEESERITRSLQESSSASVREFREESERSKRVAVQIAADLEARTERLDSAIADAQEQVDAIAGVLRQSLRELVSVVDGARHTTVASQEHARAMSEAAVKLAQAVRLFDQSVEKQSATVDNELKVQQLQQEVIGKLNQATADILAQYEKAVTQSTSMLTGEWERLANRVRALVDQSSSALLEPVEELANHVGDLKEIVRSVRR